VLKRWDGVELIQDNLKMRTLLNMAIAIDFSNIRIQQKAEEYFFYLTTMVYNYLLLFGM
jgi:hypothetical protein